MIFEKVKALIVAQLDVDPDIIDMDTDLMTDLEADSLDAVEVILGVEEEFEIEIPDEDAEDFATVRDIVEYVESRLS